MSALDETRSMPRARSDDKPLEPDAPRELDRDRPAAFFGGPAARDDRLGDLLVAHVVEQHVVGTGTHRLDGLRERIGLDLDLERR